VDDALGSTWGYTEGMTVRSADSIAREMMELASMGGNLLLNISPMGDGSIPVVQQQALLAFGEWMKTNGEGLYGARPWVRMGEGPMMPPEPPGDWKGGSTAVEGPKIEREKRVAPSEADFRFTVARGGLYAFGYKRPTREARIASLAGGKATIARVTLPGSTAPLRFEQNGDALKVTLPEDVSDPKMPYALRIEGNLPLGAS
jgi:alpha-L-fucosidase